MYQRILLWSLLLFHAAQSMELPQIIPMDLIPDIIKYALCDEEIRLSLFNQKNYQVLYTIQSKYTLQLVCKYFKRIFWNCFTLKEKDFLIWRLLKFQKKDSRYLVDVAVSMQASIHPILSHALEVQYNPECIRAIVAIGDDKVINRIETKWNWQKTVLNMAIMADHYDIVQLLLDCPMIDVNATVPLYAAVHRKNIEMIKLLLAHPQIQINAVNEYGETALFAIAEDFWRDIDNLRLTIDLLIKAGIDSSIKNNYGNTALDIMRNEAQDVVFKALEDALSN